MMDCIKLSNIRCYGYTGYLPEEQTLGQWFEVDLTIWLDLSRAGESDDLSDTMDYRQTIETVKHLVKTSKCALIEKLVVNIANAILEFDKVEQVQVQLSKPGAPIPDFGGKITLEVTRSRHNR